MTESTQTAADQAAASDASQPRKVLGPLIGLLLGMFVSMLATTVVSTSLPVIVHDLGGTQATYTWVITATLLTTAISTPIWGKLADLFSRKLLFQLAISIFVLASATAGFAQDPSMIITSRAVQGLGAGGLAALAQVIMADIISPRERGRYMGLMGAVMAVATIGGPLLGGVITDAWGWRWNFFVALPVAVVALIMVQTQLHLPKYAKRKVSIDYFGIVLLSVAVSLVLIWVTNAGTDYEWISWTTLWMVGGAVVAAIAFVIVELKVREPLIPLGLFRDRTFTLATLASIATGIAMFGASVFLSQYMQLARGATPTQAGLMTIPMIAGLLVSSVVIGQLITRFGAWKPYLIGGAVLLIAGSSLLSTIHYDTDFTLVSVYMFLLGAGVGSTMQNLVLIVQNSADPKNMGVASSGVTFFRTLGGSVGVSVMGAALATSVADLLGAKTDAIAAAIMSLGDQAPYWAEQVQSGSLPAVATMPEPLRIIFEDAYAQGISQSFLIVVPFAVLSLIAIVFLPNRPLTRLTTSERVKADAAVASSAQPVAGAPAAGAATAAAPAVSGSAAGVAAVSGSPAADSAESAATGSGVGTSGTAVGAAAEAALAGELAAPSADDEATDKVRP